MRKHIDPIAQLGHVGGEHPVFHHRCNHRPRFRKTMARFDVHKIRDETFAQQIGLCLRVMFLAPSRVTGDILQIIGNRLLLCPGQYPTVRRIPIKPPPKLMRRKRPLFAVLF